jgi:hypothetical protein
MQTRWCLDQIRPTPNIDSEWSASKHAIIAHYIGRWRKGESPLDALARALGIPSADLLAELLTHKAKHDELDLLSECLGAGWVELPGLDVRGSVTQAITLVNEKLARVPPEVRGYFGAPKKLSAAGVDWRPGVPAPH